MLPGIPSCCCLPLTHLVAPPEMISRHEDLAGNMHPLIGLNALDGSNNPMDEFGHGTHVSLPEGPLHAGGPGQAGNPVPAPARQKKESLIAAEECEAILQADISAASPHQGTCSYVDETSSNHPFPQCNRQVAGIVGAVANNGKGVSGVAWKVKILGERASACSARSAGCKLGPLPCREGGWSHDKATCLCCAAGPAGGRGRVG